MENTQMDNIKDELVKSFAKCQLIVRNSEGISPEDAFEEVSKALLVKINRERNTGRLFKIEELADVQYLFNVIKKDFELDRVYKNDESLKIKQSTFEAIIKELEAYDFSDAYDSLVGSAFDQFLSKVFKGESGEYYTPQAVADFMVKILDPQQEEMICDPCVGSGGFLAKSFEHVKGKIGKGSRKIERLRNLSRCCFFGVDMTEIGATTAKMNMAVHGGEHSNIYRGDGLLNANGIGEGMFDVVFGDIPFGFEVIRSILASTTGKPVLDLFDLGKVNGLIEVLFMERCLRLLKPGGRMGLVLPDWVLSDEGSMQKVREYFEARAKIMLIVSIPSSLFVTYDSVAKRSVVLMRKFTVSEQMLYEKIKKEATQQFQGDEEKIKQEIMKRFNYEIQIALIEEDDEDAEMENQLNTVRQEFNEYRKKNGLWEKKEMYSMNEYFYRNTKVSETEVEYGK